MHHRVRRRRHACPYCSAEKTKTHWIGGTTSRTPISIVWRRMTRSSGKGTPQDSSWTDGDGSTTWRGTRQTGLISESPLCESTMASTRVRKRESRRDRRLPSTFLTPKAPRLTGTQHRVGAARERSWGFRSGRGGGPTGRGRRTWVLHADEIQRQGLGIRGYYPGTRLVEEQGNGDAHHAPPKWLWHPIPALGARYWSEEEEVRRGRGWSRHRRSAETSRRSPGPAALGIDREEAVGGLLDP